MRKVARRDFSQIYVAFSTSPCRWKKFHPILLHIIILRQKSGQLRFQGLNNAHEKNQAT